MKTFPKYLKKLGFLAVFLSIFFLSSCSDGVLVSPRSDLIEDIINEIPTARQQVISQLVGEVPKAWNFTQRTVKDVVHSNTSILGLLSSLLLSQINNLVNQIFSEKIIFDSLGRYRILNVLGQIVEQGGYAVNELGSVLTLIPDGTAGQRIFNIELISDTNLQLLGQYEEAINIDLDAEIETALIKVELKLTSEISVL